MNWFFAPDALFGWVWRNSFQATPLILLVFIGQRLFGKRLTAGLRYALSFLVLVGLLLPAIPPSPFSLGNLFPAHARVENHPQVLLSGAGWPRSALGTEGSESGGSRPANHRRISLTRTLGWVWLAGFAGLSGIASSRYAKWRELIRRGRTITDPSVLGLLEQAKLHMGVRRPVGLSAVDHLSSPAVFGVRRVQVLLPEAVLKQLNPAELRLVILHELAHVRRNDIVLRWVLMGVQFLHWFNPLVWLALHRIRSDCELVCDALVLKGSECCDRVSYGQVLLKLTEDYSFGPRPFSGAVPVVSTKGEIKRRILMIRHYREASLVARLLTAGLVVALGCLTLTRARERVTELQTREPDADALLINIDANGNVCLDGAPALMSREQLEAALASRAATNSHLTLRIQADQNLAWSEFVKVLELARTYKIGGISARIGQQTRRTAQDGASTAGPALVAATNHGMVVDGGAVLTADRLTFNPTTGAVQADGHVRLWQPEHSLSAEHLTYNARSDSVSTYQTVAEVTIKYVGPRLVSEEQIRANIHVKVGDRLNAEAMDDDVRRLYATERFYNVRTATDPSPEGMNLCYIIQCNPRLVAIKFNGNSRFGDEDLLKRITSRIGEPFNERKLFADSQEIQRMYKEGGHRDVVVKYSYDMNQESAEARGAFAITEVGSLGSPVFQLRLVVDTPAADSEPVTLVTKRGNQSYTNVIYVQKTVLLDQTALNSAKAGTDAFGHAIIEVTLTETGKERFAEVTRLNLGKRLAIFIGGKVYQAPVIRAEIAGGAAQISGDFSKAEAEVLARKISGAIGGRK